MTISTIYGLHFKNGQVVCGKGIPLKVSQTGKKIESVTLYGYLLCAKEFALKVSHDHFIFGDPSVTTVTRKVSQTVTELARLEKNRISPLYQRIYMKSVTRHHKIDESVTLFMQSVCGYRLVSKVSQTFVFCHKIRPTLASQKCHTLALTPVGGERSKRVTLLAAWLHDRNTTQRAGIKAKHSNADTWMRSGLEIGPRHQ